MSPQGLLRRALLKGVLLSLLAIISIGGCDVVSNRETDPKSKSDSSLSSSLTNENSSSKDRTPELTDARLKIVATVAMVGSLVEMVGGDQVDVELLCGPGVDPHLYKPTRDDVLKLLKADIVFSCGLKLEGKLADALNRLSSTKVVYAVAETLASKDLLGGEEAGHSKDAYDPHVWMDVKLWAQCIDGIEMQLSQVDPANQALYRERAKLAREELNRLHVYGVDVISTIPETRRILITSHDAFGYFGRAYGLEVRGIQGLSTESEGGLQQINALVDLIVERGINSVFVESSVSRKSIDALVEGVRARGHDVGVGARELFSDAMGAAGTYEGTYIGMLDHNLTIVARDLGGVAPQYGFQGKLKP